MATEIKPATATSPAIYPPPNWAPLRAAGWLIQHVMIGDSCDGEQAVKEIAPGVRACVYQGCDEDVDEWFCPQWSVEVPDDSPGPFSDGWKGVESGPATTLAIGADLAVRGCCEFVVKRDAASRSTLATLRAALEEIAAGAPAEKPEDAGFIGNEDDAETEGWNKARYWAAEIARAALRAAEGGK